MAHCLSGLAPRRRLLAISASDVANRIGMTVNGYSRMERGERRTYFDKAIAISNFTGISLDDMQRVPDEAERVQLFKAGEARRALLTVSGGDEDLVGALSDWTQEDDA